MTSNHAQLGEVAQFINGAAFKPDDWGNEGLRIIRIQNLTDESKPYNLTKRKVDDKLVVRKGDLLVSWSATLGVFEWQSEEDGLLNQHIFRVIPNTKVVDKQYLKHVLVSALTDMSQHLHGATMKHVNRGEFLATKIPLPPLAEQQRIAAILDKAEEIKRKREQAIAKLDELAHSTFVEMFGDPVTNSKNWDLIKLCNAVIKLGSGSTPTGGDASYKAQGISLIRSLNVHDGEFVFKNLAYIDEEQAAKLANVMVVKGDVLLNITGASVARVCRVPDDVLPARVNQHVMIVRPNETLNPLYLERLLLSSQMKNKLLQIGGSGATREAITKAQAEKLDIICPPIKLQNEFARNIERILNIKDKEIQSIDINVGLLSSLQNQAFTTGFNA